MQKINPKNKSKKEQTRTEEKEINYTKIEQQKEVKKEEVVVVVPAPKKEESIPVSETENDEIIFGEDEYFGTMENAFTMTDA